MVVKRIISIVIGSAITWLSMAQDFHFSQFMQTMIYMNPACVSLPSSGEIGLTYRNQWPGIPATFVTYGASFIMPVKALSSGIGVTFMNDVQGGGVINTTSAGLVYGYMFNINRFWQIGTGISASWSLKRFNANELVFRSDLLNDLGYSYSTVVLENYTKSYPDFSIGLVARNNENLSFGVSVGHLTRPKDSFSSLTDSRVPLKYSAFVSGQLFQGGQYGGSDLTIEPAVFFSMQNKNNELIWGSQFTYNSTYVAGAWIRQNAQFSLESVIISLGISYEKYNIGYSYDVNLKKINFLSTKMAAHEVTFLYRFEYKKKKMKRIDCPAY